jgi:amino acid transporter
MPTTTAATTGTYDAGAVTGKPGAYGLRSRCLTPFEVLSQSIAVIAPSASMAAIIPLAYASAGNATWLAYLVTGIGLILVGLNVNQFTRKSASPGSLYSYTTMALGPAWGVFVSWGWLVAYIGCGIALAGAAANFMLLLFGSPTGAAWPYIAYAVAVLVPWYIAYRDIRLSTRLMLILEFSGMALISLLLIPVFMKVPFHFYVPQFTLHGYTFKAFYLGLLLAIFADIGFESSSTLGEEARDPLKTIPRTVIGAVLIAMTFYTISAFGMVGAFNASGTTLDGNADALKTMATYAGIPWLAPFLTIMVLVSAIGCTLGSFNAACRVLFAMGRHGVLHSSIGEAHKTNETPHISVSVCAGISLIIGILTMKIWGLGPTDLLNDGGSFSAYGFIVGYVMIAIAAPVYLKKQGILTPQALVYSAAALLFLVVPIVGSFYPVPDPPVLYFPYAFGVYMILGGTWLFIQNKRSGNVIQKIEADLEDINTRYELGGKRPIMHGTELEGIGETSVAPA